MKKVQYLEEYMKNSLREKGKSMWMTKDEAMQETGCNSRRLQELRMIAAIVRKYSGKSRGVMWKNHANCNNTTSH